MDLANRMVGRRLTEMRWKEVRENKGREQVRILWVGRCLRGTARLQ